MMHVLKCFNTEYDTTESEKVSVPTSGCFKRNNQIKKDMQYVRVDEDIVIVELQ